jgi:hypothetical protein
MVRLALAARVAAEDVRCTPTWVLVGAMTVGCVVTAAGALIGATGLLAAYTG